MKKIQQAVAELILANFVLKTTKTKARWYGGRQLVTVGRYQEAIRSGTRDFLLAGKGWDSFPFNAQQAAAEFIAFVGRDHAEEAVREALRESGWAQDNMRQGQYHRLLRWINGY